MAKQNLMAQNAIILSGALKRMVDAQALAQKWITYNGNKGVTADDARTAREWVKGNVTFSSSALGSALNQTHASGWAFGEKDAQQELTSSVGFNWDTWNPGNEGAAMLVDPPNGLKELMAQNGVTIKGIEDTNIDRIGTALALGLDQGLTVDETARAIDYVVSNSARSLVIARTETARALVQANLVTYRDANVESVEWLVADPCEICAANDGVVVPLGEAFPSGDTEPPAHPNCVCDVAPVLSDVSGSFGEEPPVDGEPVDGEGDVTNVSPEGEDTVIHDGVVTENPDVEYAQSFEFESAKLSSKEMDNRNFFNEAKEKYGNEVYSRSRDVTLEEMWKAQGFNELPKLVTNEKLTELVDNGWQPVFRGLAAETPEAVADYANTFKFGSDPFAGSGLFGNGTYAGNEITAQNFATKNASGQDMPHGEVMQMAINPDAKLIEYKELMKEMSQAREALSEIGGPIAERYNYPEDGTDAEIASWRESLPSDVRAQYENAERLYYDWYEDPAHFATTRGYDGYYIVRPSVGFSATDFIEDTYYNIMNRGIVAVVK